ncbi:MAG: flagellar assembly protein FliH [Burkholderiaceae bacterium]
MPTSDRGTPGNTRILRGDEVSGATRFAIPELDAPLHHPKHPEDVRESEQLREAFESGRRQGLIEGREQGETSAILRMEKEVAERDRRLGADTLARMKTLLDQFDLAFRQVEAQLADQLVDVVDNLTHRVIMRRLDDDRMIVLDVVRAALDTLREAGGEIRVRLNPADHELVAQALANEPSERRLHLIAAPEVSAGGCLLEAGDRMLDARLEQRWQLALEAIGAPPLPGEGQ